MYPKDFPTEEEERDLITEFKVLQCVGKHENIVNLIGGSIYNSGPDNSGKVSCLDLSVLTITLFACCLSVHFSLPPSLSLPLFLHPSLSPSLLLDLIIHMNISGQLLVVVEYCSGGNLLHYLRKKRGDTVNPLSVPHQLNMGSQVACGMEYLSSKKVRAIHII